MTASSANPEDPATRDLRAGPGHWLRQEREARGLSLERLAAELHLAPPLLEALEHDRYHELPAPVFVSGYLRNYARLLGLDPEPLLQAYRAASPAAAPRPAERAERSVSSGGSGNMLFRIVTLIILAGLLVLVGLWWQARQTSLDITEVEETEPPPPAFVEIPDEVAEVEAGAPLASPPAPTTGEEPPPAAPLTDQPVTSPADEAAPPAETTETAALPGTADEGPADESVASAPGEVVLIFDGPCWVDIRDTSREFKLFGEMGKGDRRVLGGTPPYSIIIGNAAAVTITIDDEPFDLASRARGNVARFTLDPAAVR